MNDRYSDTMKIASDAFSRIFFMFPNLQVVEDKDSQAEICWNIPVQDGLKFKVGLDFQNMDELHFTVESFWLEWFPCTKPENVESYIDAVTGFLSGNYRIIETLKGKNCIKSELQKPENSSWKVIRTVHHIGLPSFRKKTYREIRNI